MAAINPLGHLKAMQGRWEPRMASCDDTLLIFQMPPIPPDRFVMLMAQATVRPASGGPHEVGVLFELWHDGDCETPVAHYEARITGQDPIHSTVCMAYLSAGPFPPNTELRVTIRPSQELPGSTITPQDFYSISVVELEQSAEIASLVGPEHEASKDAKQAS